MNFFMKRRVSLLETSSYYRKLLEMAVLAGEIMISSGAETHRVEDTMQRILRTTNFAHAEAFIFPTGIIATLSDPSSETLSATQRVSNRAQNFGRVADVNAVSRKFCSGKMTLDEAYTELKQIKERIRYPEWAHMLGLVFASGFFALMFGGELLDGLGRSLRASCWLSSIWCSVPRSKKASSPPSSPRCPSPSSPRSLRCLAGSGFNSIFKRNISSSAP